METQQKNIIAETLYHEEAEKSLLCCLINDDNVRNNILYNLDENDFYFAQNKMIFRELVNKFHNNEPIEYITLCTSLAQYKQTCSVEYVRHISEFVFSYVNYMQYYKTVKEKSNLRKLNDIAKHIIDKSVNNELFENILTFAEKEISEIQDASFNKQITSISDIIPNVLCKIEDLVKYDSKYRGQETGFTGIDYILNGLNKNELIIIAARPSMGKTSLALNIASNIASNRKSVCAIFSLEMSELQICQRLICSMAEINLNNIIRKGMQDEDWDKLKQAQDKLSNMKIFVDDSSIITTAGIMAQCKKIQKQYGLDLVIIDYIQLMCAMSKNKNTTRQQEITEISRSLKLLAKELNIPVIVLSQLSRAIEIRKSRPQLSDLRESGAIEQDADIVMFIHRPDKVNDENAPIREKIEENVAEIIIAKNRNGATGMTKLYFDQQYVKFINYKK